MTTRQANVSPPQNTKPSVARPLISGTEGEALAAAFLSRQGVKILERNFRVRGGEIDLIGQHGAMTLFVEVRVRSNTGYGGAAASITPAKQRKLILAARHWLARYGERPCRFDCVLMDGDRASKPQWLQDAFRTD